MILSYMSTAREQNQKTKISKILETKIFLGTKISDILETKILETSDTKFLEIIKTKMLQTNF